MTQIKISLRLQKLLRGYFSLVNPNEPLGNFETKWLKEACHVGEWKADLPFLSPSYKSETFYLEEKALRKLLSLKEAYRNLIYVNGFHQYLETKDLGLVEAWFTEDQRAGLEPYD